MEIVKYRKIYFFFSAILLLASLIFLAVFGLEPGIEFTGGSILEVEYAANPPANLKVRELLAGLDLREFFLQPTGENGLILRMKEISDETRSQILARLGEGAEVAEVRFESIGPVIGRELLDKTNLMVFLALAAVVSYVAFAFRGIVFPLKSWKYGVVSLLSLLHDILIPLGIFALLGQLYGTQITIPVVVALLTVLGYSINSTVVIFDRIRENLLKKIGSDYGDAVNKAINQNLVRTLNTSLTTIFALGALYFFGGETLRYFSLALMLGVAAGTYSSVFLAGPLLVSWLKWKEKGS